MFIYAALRREQLEFVKETPSLLLGCARVELRTTTTKPVVDSSSVKNGRGGQSLEEGRAGRWLSGSFHTLWMGPHTKDQRLESSLIIVERGVFRQ